MSITGNQIVEQRCSESNTSGVDNHGGHCYDASVTAMKQDVLKRQDGLVHEWDLGRDGDAEFWLTLNSSRIQVQNRKYICLMPYKSVKENFLDCDSSGTSTHDRTDACLQKSL